MNILSGLIPKKYVFSFLFSFLSTLLVLSLLSIVFSFFPPPQVVLDVLYNYSYLVSVFTASLLCARARGRKGLVTGILSALIYAGMLVLMGIILFKNTPAVSSLMKTFFLSSLFGAIGGILGINSK